MVTYRKYKNGDEKDILTLYNNIYKSSRDEEYWKWQFKEYPFGEAIIELAQEYDRIIGQTTILPTEINYKGNVHLGGYSIDSIVDKEYRRQGIYVDLANKNYESAIAKKVQFRYGFPIYGTLLGLTIY